MDYLREVGRRQQALLARLLLGANRQEAVEETMDTAEAMTGDGQAWELPGAAPGMRFFETEAAEKRTAETLEEQAETVALTRQADALWREVPQTASRPGALMTVREGGDAEAFSRAVQRDARRYDGGFTMF